MRIKFKKLKIILIFSLILFSSGLIFAQTRRLEVNYPEIHGLKPETVKDIEIYGKYLFNISVFLVGLILFISLIHAGIIYLTSAGNPARLKDAKDRIVAAFLGLFLLLGSYIVLTKINPQLAIFKPPELKKGVACKENKDCPRGYECEGGECKMKESCQTDEDCPYTYKCEGGKCQKMKEALTQIFYEIPLGQMLEKGLWNDTTTTQLSNLISDFEKNFLTTERSLSPETVDRISDFYKYLSKLTEDCHCEVLEAICLKPKNYPGSSLGVGISVGPIGTQGDVCKEVRGKINEMLEKSLEIMGGLMAYKDEFKNKKEIFEEEGRKYRNLEEILEKCKKKELLTRNEYYSVLQQIHEMNGDTKLIKSYLPSLKDDPLVFYCAEGGTIYDYPYKIPEISEEELEEAKKISPPGPGEEFAPLSCPGYIPLGSTIDDELTSLSVDLNMNLDMVIFYIDKILEEIEKMHEAVFSCNDSHCNISCGCIPNPCYEPRCGNPPTRKPKCGIGNCRPPTPHHPNFCYFFCDSPCLQSLGGAHGEPCDRQSLKEIPQRIKMWEDELLNALNRITNIISDANNIKKREGEINLPAIKESFQKCLDLEAKSKPEEEETYWALLRCDLAIGNRGPDGEIIRDCHPNDFYCCTNKPVTAIVEEFPEAGRITPPKPIVYTPLTLATSSPSLSCEKFPHFSQWDDRWKNLPYTRECGETIGRSGCGPTSMAMVLNYFGIQTDPSIEANWAAQKGYRVCGAGTAHGYFSERAKDFGLKCIQNDIKGILEAVKKGNIAIVSGRGPPPYTKGGHYIVLTKIEDEWGEEVVYYNDPKGPKGVPACGKVPKDFFLKHGINFGCIISR